jgi:hypothetical protein
MFYYLQPIIGYPWAVRVIGFTMLATFSISIAVMRVRMRTSEKKRMFDLGAFKELPFIVFALGVAMAFCRSLHPVLLHVRICVLYWIVLASRSLLLAHHLERSLDIRASVSELARVSRNYKILPTFSYLQYASR